MESRSNSPIFEDLEFESDLLLMVFGSGVGKLAELPPFEFCRATRHIKCKKLFLRDTEKVWYQAGFPPFSNDIPSSIRYFKNFIATHRIKKVVTMGVSMGGYASILYGHYLNAHRILAFAPQIFVDKEQRLSIGDTRRQEYAERMYTLSGEKYYDLRTHLLERNPVGAIDIIICGESELDVIHANHVQDIPNIKIVKYPCNVHPVARYLRDQRQLFPLIQQEIEDVCNCTDV